MSDEKGSRDYGKVAIVTGGGTGLGAAAAAGLAARGLKVAVTYSKSRDDAEAVAKSLPHGLALQGDVGDDSDCRRVADAVLTTWGRIDVLVNNAGTTKFAAHGDLEALSADDFLGIYRTNVVGAFQMLRAVAPAMRKQGAGSVVNVSSIAGVAGIGSSAAYAASKGALNTLTISMARALGPEIRVNAVCPGFIGTRWFLDRFGQERFDQIVAQQAAVTPLKRAGTPEDVAEAIIFLALDAARHMTGETLLIDAGLHLDFTPLKAR